MRIVLLNLKIKLLLFLRFNRKIVRKIMGRQQRPFLIRGYSGSNEIVVQEKGSGIWGAWHYIKNPHSTESLSPMLWSIFPPSSGAAWIISGGKVNPEVPFAVLLCSGKRVDIESAGVGLSVTCKICAKLGPQPPPSQKCPSK